MKKVHFSIDDVGSSLEWLAHNRPNSIFDMRFFGKLRYLHEKYGTKISLYCFPLCEELLSADCIEQYYNEFYENSDWLKFAYHGRSEMRFCDNEAYVGDIEKFIGDAKKIGMSLTDIIRLHYWDATEEQKNYLKAIGIHAILYRNDDSIQYNERDFFIDGGVQHWRTTVQFERIKEINYKTCGIAAERIVAFTHENKFEQNFDKIESALKIYIDNGYEFL